MDSPLGVVGRGGLRRERMRASIASLEHRWAWSLKVPLWK